MGGVFDARLDLYPLLAATLASVGCALLGNFLVLRRLSLMGDAISHSVLPGLVIAFLIASTRSPVVMLIGAASAGVVTVVLVEVVKRFGRVEPGAAMGVVFSVLFAVGVLLIERASVRHVDLDADCVLHGQLEMLALREEIPRQVWTLAGMCAGAAVFVVVFFKELRIAAFDPSMASAQGFNAGWMHYALMIGVAGATVASFEAVGSILVIAMLVCPPAGARMLTDRLVTQVLVSVCLALASALGGYFGASIVPGLFGLDSVNAAGSIAVVSGVLLTLAILASPSHGVVARAWRQRGLVARITRDDALAALYRADEHGEPGMTAREIARAIGRRARVGEALRRLESRGLVLGRAEGTDERWSLTEPGRDSAREVVRRHRLWERYLVDEAGFSADHVHDPAELLEHLPLVPRAVEGTDPHGRDIPDGGR